MVPPPIHPHFPCTYSFGGFSFTVRVPRSNISTLGKLGLRVGCPNKE